MTILVAVGEEQRESPVIPVAYDLAQAYDDDLVVLHVVPSNEFENYRATLQQIEEFIDYSITQHEGSAARIAHEIVDSSLDEYDEDRVSMVGGVGNRAEEILSVADELDVRYLVIGGRRRSPAGKALFGSVTQTVLLNATAPTVTVMLD